MHSKSSAICPSKPPELRDSPLQGPCVGDGGGGEGAHCRVQIPPCSSAWSRSGREILQCGRLPPAPRVSRACVWEFPVEPAWAMLPPPPWLSSGQCAPGTCLHLPAPPSAGSLPRVHLGPPGSPPTWAVPPWVPRAPCCDPWKLGHCGIMEGSAKVRAAVHHARPGVHTQHHIVLSGPRARKLQ